MPPDSSRGRDHRHTNVHRFSPRLPKDVYEVWTGALKGKGTRYLIEGARKYLEENGHSVVAMEEEVLRQEEVVLHEMHKLQMLRSRTEGMRAIHPAAPARTPPSPTPTTPPTNGRGNGNGALEKVEKEFRAYHRSQERAHVPREERRKNLLGKCQEVLQRNKDLQASFRAADDLLAYFAKRIL